MAIRDGERQGVVNRARIGLPGVASLIRHENAFSQEAKKGKINPPAGQMGQECFPVVEMEDIVSVDAGREKLRLAEKADRPWLCGNIEVDVNRVAQP
ncbi:MAG: hypothetical protein V1809_00740 [Planctomycetota bacterium]